MKKLFFTGILLLSTQSFASKIVSQEVKFVATGKPSFIKAKGNAPLTNSEMTLKDNKLSGSFTVALDKLDSGIELRDTHLKEKYLQTQTYPKAIFSFKDVSLESDNQTITVKGEFEFHGVKKEKEIEIEISKEGNQLNLVSDFEIKLTDYKVELPSFSGITAADKVKIDVETKIEL